MKRPYGLEDFVSTGANTVDIHVYGKDLTGLQRLKFDLDKAAAATFASPKYDNC